MEGSITQQKAGACVKGRWECSTWAEVITNFGKTGFMKLDVALHLNVT